MLNQTVMVGRLVQDPEIKELENGEKVGYITLAVPRSYKNEEGVYDTDFIPVTLFKGIAENTIEYCKKGDMVGVKGRVESSIITDDGNTIDENQKKEIKILAERVTFLSNRKESE